MVDGSSLLCVLLDLIDPIMRSLSDYGTAFVRLLFFTLPALGKSELHNSGAMIVR